MTRPLFLNAFVMNTASHIHHGQWRHPEARQAEFNDLELWLDVARTLERGLFDGIFFADVSGLYGPADGVYRDNVHEGLQIPSNDPAVLLGALAAATEQLGLAYTSNVMQNHPFNFARQVSTLDHLSKGRIAWNIVTSTQENAARNFGLDALVEHDARYDWAEEYMEVVYKLWEGSWDEDAVLRDTVGNRFADPDKIHKIHHVGQRYRVDGPHLPSPSPQRTPLLFQAGGSARGTAFAALHAEAVFLATPNPEVARAHVEDARRLAVQNGRLPGDVTFWQGLTFVVGSTPEDAQRRVAEYREWSSTVGYLTHASIGVLPDGTRLPEDTLLKDIENNGGQGHVEWLRRAYTDREPTLADLAINRIDRGLVVGTADQIADELERWRAAGVDGINVMNWRLPGTYDELVERLLPTLRRRGLVRSEYDGDTYRGRIFGYDRLPDRHPAARWRGAFTPTPALG